MPERTDVSAGPGGKAGGGQAFPATALVFLVVFGVYLHTQHPAFKADDSPNTITACATLASQHIPGYPLVTLTGRLFALVPAGGVCFRVNMAAAAWGALAAALLFALFLSLCGGRFAKLGGALAVTAWAFAPPVWDTALSAKGLIYQMNLAMLAGMLLCLAKGGRAADRGALLASLLAGLGMGGHWMTMLWFIPLVPLGWGGWTRRKALLAAAFFAVPLSVYLQLPFSVMREPVWGNAAGFGGLLDMVTRRDLVHHSVSKPGWVMPIQVLWGLFMPVRECGALYAVVSVAGAVWLWVTARRFSLLLWTLVAATSLAIAAATNPLHAESGELMLWHADAYYLPYALAMALSFGAGVLAAIRSLPSRLRLGGAAVAVAGTALIPAFHYAGNDHSSDYLGYDYGLNALAEVRGPSVVAGRADFGFFPLIPHVTLDNRAPGVRLLVLNFLQRGWGWRRLPQAYSACLPGVLPKYPSPDDVAGFISCLSSREEVYLLGKTDIPALDGAASVEGLLKPMARRPRGVSIARFRMRGLFSGSPPRDGIVSSVLDGYAVARAQPGEEARMRGDFPGAIREYRAAARYPGWLGLARVWRNIGIAEGLRGDNRAAEEAFRNAVSIRHRDAESWGNLGIACAVNGKKNEARKYLRYSLQLKPGNENVLRALAGL